MFPVRSKKQNFERWQQMKVTIFTPTYNRAYILGKLYRSLQRQTCRDFEWLIIDDGSSDDTEALVATWLEEGNDFSIRYYQVPNGGKHRAINKALDLAQGELFFTVDSDDYLTDDAIEKILRWEAELPENHNFCGIAGNLSHSPEVWVNSKFDQGFLDGTALDRYGAADGERAMVFYTHIHRLYKYPEFDGERFMTEAVTWNRMAADGYKIRFYNDIIWIFEYRADGLTAQGNQLFMKNPRGYGLWLREKAKIQEYSLKDTMKMWYAFTCDHSFGPKEHRLTAGNCARYIGAPLVFVWISRAGHWAMMRIKK